MKNRRSNATGIGVKSVPVARGRREAGTVRDWAKRLNVVEVIERAMGVGPAQQEILLRVWDCPVHVGQLGRTAGYATNPSRDYPYGLIELHQELESSRIPAHELSDTFLHEVGHLIDFYERKKTDHSSAWKKVMARLGKPNEQRCHNLDLGQKIKLCCPQCGNQQGTRMPYAEVKEKISHKRICDWCLDCRVVTREEVTVYIREHGSFFPNWPEELKARLKV